MKKKTGKCDPYTDKKKKRQAIKMLFEEVQAVHLADKDFKAVLISMFEALKVTMLKEIKEGNKG